jgi:GNAT superfamily N-acetyltransferase
MILIEELGIEKANQVIDLVRKLAVELGGEDDEFGRLDNAKILADWEVSKERFVAFVAIAENSEVLGIITLAESFAIYAGGCYGAINELYVLPKHRNKNVGKMLVETAKDYGRDRGWRRLDVTAPPGDKWQRSVNFYLREGFAHTGPKLRFML